MKPDDRKKQRQINLKPLVEAFFAWAKEIQTSSRLTKGKTLEGSNYCINQEEALKVFLDDGEVPLDNNARAAVGPHRHRRRVSGPGAALSGCRGSQCRKAFAP